MNTRVIINFLVFQCAWFACVLLTGAGRPLAGGAAAIGAVVLHIALSRKQIVRECALIASAAIIGVALDGAAVWFGLLRLPGGAGALTTLLWFAALWAAFSTLLGQSLAWMWKRPALSAVCGAVAGPLSYAGGARLGALVCERSPWCYAWLAVEWAIAMPLLLTLAPRLLAAKPTEAR